MAGALQIVNTFKQNLTGGTTYDNFASGTGDVVTASDGSLIVPSFPDGATCHLEEIWAVDDDSPLTVSLTGPDFSDREFGLMGQVAVSKPNAATSAARNISPGKLSQTVRSGNQFFVRGLGTAADNANIIFLLRYSLLPGITARLASSQTIHNNAGNIVGVEVGVDASSGIGQGDWSAPVALTADQGRRLDGVKYYAILGFTSSLPLAAVAVSAFETGQLKIGAPCLGDSEHDPYSIYDVADRYQDALIPVIQGYSQDNVQVFCADPTVTTASVVVHLVEVPQAVFTTASASAV